MATTEPASKKRTSQCREWERNRRNKFNDAITKLGEIVREINKMNNAKEPETRKQDDNAKYPKIEIVQKAIICLANCSQEKTQLRAEILALQVKLDKTKADKKDASTQVHIEIQKINKNGKYIKLVKQKNKNDNIKETSKQLKENTNKLEKALAPKLPYILPRCNIFDKKAPENAIVVLPAAPYIFPQRPLLFPTVPPAIVVMDTLQTFNKTVPIISRNSGDITKTTMVNILPISAYSRPLSATNHKKNHVKLKRDTTKKVVKKKKLTSKGTELNKNIEEPKSSMQPQKEEVGKTADNTSIQTNTTINVTITSSSTDTDVTSSAQAVVSKENDQKNTNTDNHKTDMPIQDASKATNDLTKVIKNSQLIDTKSEQQNGEPVAASSNTNINDIPSENTDKTKLIEDNKFNKDSIEKNTPVEEKDKENKFPNLLDTTLCDNVVDGGNARLELAEEFLAASPTAAFLLSFPLVSGNRADSPAEDPQNAPQTQSKDNNHKRNEDIPHNVQTSTTYLEKPTNTDSKSKSNNKTISNKSNIQEEKHNIIVRTSKVPEVKSSTVVTNENPFLNLPMPSLISTNCTISDSTFGLDFDCSLNKTIPSQATTYNSNTNIFHKNDPFSTVKNTIYSTSSISSTHEFNSLGLYPCAMEKYSSKNKSDFTNMDDNNLMKIGSSRLTYDIDLGWSHKEFEFVNNCSTSSATFAKDNILTSVSSTPFSTSYNPFNPDFHVPLVSSSSKKDVTNKVSSSFADTLTNFYSQPSNLWSEEPFYTNSNVSKTLSSRHQNYLPIEHVQPYSNIKQNNVKHYEAKDTSLANVNTAVKSTNHSIGQQLNDKYTKKSPSKMHINWMTSEVRPMSSNCNATNSGIKEPQKLSYDNLGSSKRHEANEGSNNYFPLSMHNFPTQTNPQEDFHMWPSARPLGTAEISIDPPPINLPTLVGDLALGPHDKKKNLDSAHRVMPQQDIQNCTNFFSVTQLMNRSNDNSSSRYQPPQIETTKSFSTKQNISQYSNNNDTRKVMPSRIDSHIPQPYAFNDSKPIHSYENMAVFSNSKKLNSKPDKNPKTQKNNYSAEALLRGGNFTQKIPDNSNKFISHSQRHNDFNTGQDSVAQVSHFPPIIDYTDNTYASQQLSGTSLYNTTTNTMSNSFYSNFMPGSSNLMSGNYASGPFPGEFIDYNQSAECNYSNHKYEELKMRNNPPTFPNDKVPYKSSRRESAAKHKLECSKKESSKKYQSKRSKMNNTEVEEWNDPSHSSWQTKTSSRKHPNLMTEELPFPNYVNNQMPSQYQPDYFNSHLMSSNMQPVGHNVDRSIASFPITSRANFNLSTIFPEITMKVQ